jgi:hypothetical protein
MFITMQYAQCDSQTAPAKPANTGAYAPYPLMPAWPLP